MADSSTEPPEDIDPYNVLQLETTASQEEVKSAYKKLALHHHPDKVAQDARESAHVKFQEIAFAYAILSEPRRRHRYDTTGNTSESVDIDDDFDWSSYFKAQYADLVTGQKLQNLKESYQHSDDEKRDVLAAYTTTKGKMDKLFEQVMMSNPLYDESRFRQMIEKAIEDGMVEAYTSFREEPESKRVKRQRRAAKESDEAMKYARELGVYDELFKPENDAGKTDVKTRSKPRAKKQEQEPQESALASLIQKNRAAKAESFLDQLEAKYVGMQDAKDMKKGQKGKKGPKRKLDEPPEDLFQNNRQKKRRTPEAKPEESDDEDVADLGSEDSESSTDEEESEDATESRKSKSKVAKGHNKNKYNTVKDAKSASSKRISTRKAGAKR